MTGGRFGSAEVAHDHPLPNGIAAAAERVTGTRPPLVGVPYGADMRLFINEGIPVSCTGPAMFDWPTPPTSGFPSKRSLPAPGCCATGS